MKAIHPRAFELIERLVCERTGVTPVQLCQGRGTESVVWARYAAMTLCREHTTFSTGAIAARFGRKNQSNCHYAVTAIRDSFALPDSVSRARARVYVELSALTQKLLA